MNRYPTELKIIYQRIIDIRNNRITKENLIHKSNEAIENLKIYYKKSKKNADFIYDLRSVLSIIPEAQSSVIKFIADYNPNSSNDNLFPLTDIEYSTLLSDLYYFQEELNSLLPDSKTTTSQKKSKTGRRPYVFSFSCTLTINQITELFNLALIGFKGDAEFIKQKSNSDSSKIDLENFILLLQSDNYSDLLNNRWKFQCGIPIYAIAFIFWWLDEKGKMASPFTAIQNSKMFYDNKNQLLNRDKLHQSLKSFHFDFYYKPVNSDGSNLEVDSDKKTVLNYLHFRLTEILKMK